MLLECMFSSKENKDESPWQDPQLAKLGHLGRRVGALKGGRCVEKGLGEDEVLSKGRIFSSFAVVPSFFFNSEQWFFEL